MGDMSMVKYEAEVEKLCAAWMGEVAKMLEDCEQAVKARSRLLGQKIASLPVPEPIDPKVLPKVPDRINEILTRETSDLKGIVDLELSAKIDTKSRKVTIDGFSVAGAITKL